MTDDLSRDRLRSVVRTFEQTHQERAWGWRFLMYGVLVLLLGVALGACGDAGAGAVAGPKPDCARVITVPFHDATVVGTLTVTVFYPDSLKRNCGPASGG